SVLRNPQVSTQLAIAEELGFLLGIISLFWIADHVGLKSALAAVFPFAAATGIFALLKDEKRNKNINKQLAPNLKTTFKVVTGVLNPFAKTDADTILGSIRKPPYFYFLVGLFMIVACLKSLQWFG